MKKRTSFVLVGMLILATALFYRVFWLSMDTSLQETAQNQSSYLLTVGSTRGMIYDCNGKSLVNFEEGQVAAVLPSDETAVQLLEEKEGEERQKLYETMQKMYPFVTEVGLSVKNSSGTRVYPRIVRYREPGLAEHIIGYVNVDNVGMYGIEKAYNTLLTQYTGSLQVRCQVDALRRAFSESRFEEIDNNYQSRGGVMLTLDRDVQEAAQEVFSSVEKGALLVLDAKTGAIRASVSKPSFSQNNPALSLKSEDGPFVNRAFSAYNVGSVFKMVVCAAALENGIGTDYTYNCVGATQIDGQVFYCHNHAGHHELNMQQALELSCNPYFISLAREVGAQKLWEMAKKMGFGTADELYDGYRTAAGTLPEVSDLSARPALANFSFGQGTLTATPLQIAKMISVFLNDGEMVVPQLVAGTVNEQGEIREQAPYARKRIVSKKTAQIIRDFLVTTVTEGSGKEACPSAFGAGGKTGSAQTGLYQERENGEETEIVQAWFAGFFPDEEPQYIAVVLVEDGDSGATVAAPIFRQLADRLTMMGKIEGVDKN